MSPFLLLAMLLHLSAGAALSGEALTLEQGIQITIQNNPSLKASEYQLEAAEQGVLEARGNFLPRLDLSESFTRTTGPGEVFWTELSQERFSLPEFSMTNPNDPNPISNYNTRLTLIQPIYSGGKITAGYQISKLQREAAFHGRERTRQEIIREFTAAYFGALLADRFVHVAELAETAVQSHVKMAQDLMDHGMALRSDLLRAKVHLSEVEARLVTAKNQRSMAEANLNRIMGVNQGKAFDLVDTDDTLETVALDDLDQLIREAKQNRPDLLRLGTMEQGAEKVVRMARSSYLPSLNLVARYDKNDRDFMGEDGEYWTIMAVASMNLFEGLSSKARVGKANAEKAQMSSLLTQAVQGIELEVRLAYLNQKEALARLEIARRAVDNAEEGMRIIEDRYGSGMAQITELLDTETALTGARANEARARYDLSIARTDLDLAVGRL